ncbi:MULTISPECIES: DUF2975 domain-containing protein [unclassified Enterococcus]|jgi:hypothetical protein|uniref:DUF2975 domain-containing protein n=1 Tax=unclassified Enterococcus TaxID=2608891 RepID=UPI00035277DE|nr:hypothetical protein D920_02355 [Enterococcus faecalis 13-SD-W-01]
MKQTTLFLKAAIGLLAAMVAFFDFMLAMGLNNSAENTTLYGEKILCGAALYITSFLIFFGLYQIYRLLKLIDKDLAFSNDSLKIVRKIKNTILVIFPILLGILPMAYRIADGEDAPGIMVIGLGITMIPLVAGAFAATIEKLLRNAISIKNENDLTV